LYQKHYSKDLGHPQATDNIINESGLEKIEKNELYGDVVYLEKRGYINGQYILGYAYPPWISITSEGIDFVERVIDESIETIDDSSFGENVKSEIKEISNETNPSIMVRRVVEYAQSHNDPWVNIVNIAKEKFYN
jgi:hypothetical protein